MEGTLRKGDNIYFMATGIDEYNAEEIGYLKLKKEPVDKLEAGDVGYVIGSVKTLQHVRVGDTITHNEHRAAEPIAGYKEVKPMVFSGIYPTQSDDFEDLRGALEKLQLNDSSLQYQPERSEEHTSELQSRGHLV